jgi:hypothetical protein
MYREQEQTAARAIRRLRAASWLSWIAQVLVLIIVAAAALWPSPVDPQELFAGWSGSDLINSHWPFALLIQRTFAQTHQLPFWNPYFGGGLPVGADPLAALFYPPTQLVHLFSLRTYFLVLIMAHLVFAGLGTLLLARRALKLPTFPALVAAVSYMATPRLLSHLGAGHITIVQTVCWYPWLALAGWATIRNPRRWGALLAVCIAFTLLAGHPQMAYYGMLMVGALAVWMLVKRWREQGWRTLRSPLAGLVAACALGLLLAALHLLPLLELTRYSTRQVSVNTSDAIPLPAFLLSLVVLPSNTGSPWENFISPGHIVLILAVLAAVARWRRVWPLVLGVGLVAGLAMGNALPIYPVISRVLPEMDLFRGVARIWFVALLLIALLAGIGTEVLLQAARRFSFRGAIPLAHSLTLVLVVLSLVAIDVFYTRTGPIGQVVAPSALTRTALQLAGDGRIYSEQEGISQTEAVELQARLANGFDPLLLEAYVTYMQRAGGYSHPGYNLHIPYDSPSVQPDAALLGLMNVSVVVSQRPLTDPLLVKVAEVDGTLIYKNTADAGPAYLVQPSADGQPPALDQFQRLAGDVRVLALAPEAESFSFSSDAQGYLVIATPQFPGWTASLDGHAVPIQLFAGTMPAIKVGPGTHTLSYTYTPTYVRTGALLSAIGLLATFVWFIAGCFPWRRGKRTEERGRESEDGEREEAALKGATGAPAPLQSAEIPGPGQAIQEAQS